MSNRVLITHSDFDGVTCAFDHHKTALHLNQFGWATVETEFAGAVPFYFFLITNGSLPESISGQVKRYHALTFYANDHDLWRHKSPHSAVLNSLLHTIGPERFINRFLRNPSVELTETEKLLLEIEKEKEEKSIREAVETAKVCDSFAITFAERYASQIGQKLLETFPAVDIAVIVNARKGTVSFRSRETDVSALAKALGGGGHPNAAGFTLPKHLFHDEIAGLLMEVQSQ